MAIPRTVKNLTLGTLVAGTAALSVGQPALATTAPVSERYAGRAGAQVAELSLLGRSAVFGSALTDSTLEAIAQQLSATATGTGVDVAPATRSVARFRDASATGGTSCARPPIDVAVADGLSKLQGTDSGALPAIEVAPACGGATVTGTPEAFTAESVGGRTQVTVKLSDALKSVIGKATEQLAPATLATPVGDLMSKTTAGNAEAAKAVDTLNGVLGSLVPGVPLPAMEPTQTVANLLDRLQSSDLLRMDLASATARNGGDAKTFVAEALSDGGVIDVLPGFRGAGTAPLLRMTITRSRATVPVERASLAPVPSVENAVVRLESDVLGSLPVAGASDLGLRSGTGVVEVAPGRSLSVLCDGPVAPLCSEISVSAAKAPVTLPNGATHAESSTVTMHLFKGLDTVAPGANLGTVLAQPKVANVLEGALPAGTTLGTVNRVPGIRLVSGGVVAEATGARVLGAEALQTAPAAPSAAPDAPVAVPVPAGDLPHTGGEPFSPLTAPALACSSLAVGTLVRRLRRA